MFNLVVFNGLLFVKLLDHNLMVLFLGAGEHYRGMKSRVILILLLITKRVFSSQAGRR